jgi:hypothetical protein
MGRPAGAPAAVVAPVLLLAVLMALKVLVATVAALERRVAMIPLLIPPAPIAGASSAVEAIHIALWSHRGLAPVRRKTLVSGAFRS